MGYRVTQIGSGRKSYIDARAVLVLILLHFQLGYGANYQHIADSLEYALNAEDLTLLNITNVSSDREDWYKRFCRATHRLIAVMDPHPGPRRHRLDAEEYAAALANFSPEHLTRIDWLCESLVHMTTGPLKKISLTATPRRTTTTGRRWSSRTRTGTPRSSASS